MNSPRDDKSNSISIHVEEYHNQVLFHIYRGIGSKLLPFSGITLLHFDSHPDLGIPPDLKAKDVFQKDILLDSLQIESWILPAVFAGHINKVIWIKPEWSTQIPEGKYEFAIGKDPRTECIRVSSTLHYFVSESLFVEENTLLEKKTFILHVITLNTAESTPILLADLFTKDEKYVLDIDLDFFSTCNPFREMFSAEDLSTLTELYWFEAPRSSCEDDVKSCQENRMLQLNQLKIWLHQILKEESINDERFVTLQQVVKNYKSSLDHEMDEEDIEIFHGAGCTTDDPELPHHISTDREIHDLLKEVKRNLDTLQSRPLMVTIARSAEDGYCPAQQVEHIQEQSVTLLQQLYISVFLHKHYLD